MVWFGPGVGWGLQAISAWREADVRNIGRAARIPRAQIVHLDQNYRSQANRVAAQA